MMKSLILISASLMIMMVNPANGAGKLHKCKNESGKTTYSQFACKNSQEKIATKITRGRKTPDYIHEINKIKVKYQDRSDKLAERLDRMRGRKMSQTEIAMRVTAQNREMAEYNRRKSENRAVICEARASIDDYRSGMGRLNRKIAKRNRASRLKRNRGC